MIIVIDFDGVLFDDERFKKDYTLGFERFGISKAAYQSAYRAAKIKTGGYYAPDVHLAILQKQYPDFPKKELARAISVFVKTSFRYVYPDAEEFLSYFKKQNADLFLVSTGPSFQREKIKASGLTHFFKNIIVVKSASKKEPIRRISAEHPGQFIPPPSRIPRGLTTGMNGVFKSFPQGPIHREKMKGFIFIDDKKELLDEVKKEFPQAIVIQIRRRRTVPKSARADAAVKNMREAEMVCQKILGQKS